MPALSIFMRDNDPNEDSLVSAQEAAVLGSPQSQGPRPILSELRLGGLDDEKLPESVLSLPEVGPLVQESPGQPISWGSRAYWAALALGALFAMWLILGAPKQSTPVPSDEGSAQSGAAPAAEPPVEWNPNANSNSIQMSSEPSNRASAAVESHAVGGATTGIAGQPAPPSANLNPNQSLLPQAPMAQPYAVPAAQYQGAPVPPTAQYQAAPVPPSAEIRTARGGATRWDGSPSGVRPSEAAPLGITTPVSP